MGPVVVCISDDSTRMQDYRPMSPVTDIRGRPTILQQSCVNVNFFLLVSVMPGGPAGRAAQSFFVHMVESKGFVEGTRNISEQTQTCPFKVRIYRINILFPIQFLPY